MWDLKVRLLDDDPIAVQNQIEVERPGRARVWTLAAEMVFDAHESDKEVTGGKRRAAGCSRVQEARLVPHSHRIGVMEGRDAKMVDRKGQFGQRLAKVPFPIA
jgi:hypothetical protein